MNTNKTAKSTLGFVRSNPSAAAAMSKAIKNTFNGGFDISSNQSYYQLNHGKIKAVSDAQKSRLAENDDILKMFPDISLCEQIIVSSVLAPKDLVSGALIFKTKETLLPASIQSQINQIIKSNLENNYGFKDDLSDILKTALFREGSCPMLVIPEAAIDDVINGVVSYSTESFSGIVTKDNEAVPIGILGSPDEKNSSNALESFLTNSAVVSTTGYVSLESFNENALSSKIKSIKIDELCSVFKGAKNTSKLLEITDNFQLLKLSRAMGVISKNKIRNILGSKKFGSPKFSLESVSKEKNDRTSRADFVNMVYKTPNQNQDSFITIKTSEQLKRYNIGRPLRTRIPSESIIPVYPPGEPTKHKGYFIMVDANGNWVSRNSVENSLTGVHSLLKNSGQDPNLSSSLLNSTRKNMAGDIDVVTIDNMAEIYGSIVENDIINRLRNGVYGTKMEMTKDKEWDRVMLARALRGKLTRLVYVPAELITYYAFDYYPNGVGKSYLDNIRLLASLRAVHMFAKLMAQMKNSIGVTKVDMTIDPRDPDPQKTIEVAAGDILKLRESFNLTASMSPNDIMNFINRAGVMFTFNSHPRLPDTKFEFSTSNMAHQAPEQDIDDELKKRMYMGFGLNPDTVDNGFGPEFATSLIQQNALLNKRIELISNAFSIHLTKDAVTTCMNDSIILDEIFQVLMSADSSISKNFTDEQKEEYAKDKDNFFRKFVGNVVENIVLDLPKPDNGDSEVKIDSFEKYEKALDMVLKSFVSSEVFTQTFGGDFSQHADEISVFWKHMLLRKFVVENGILPDISILFDKDENGNPSNDVAEVMDNYTNDVMLSAIKFIEKKKSAKDAVNKDLQTIDAGEGSGPSTDDSGGDTSAPTDEFNSDFSADDPVKDDPDGDKTDKGDEFESGEDDPDKKS